MKTKLILMFKVAAAMAILLMSDILYSQTFNRECGRIDVYNNNGENLADFIFSYDVIGGFHSCNNNFMVVNNFNIPVSFRFEILMNGYLYYTGSVALDAYGSYFFNDAFQYCNTVNSTIVIRLI